MGYVQDELRLSRRSESKEATNDADIMPKEPQVGDLRAVLGDEW